MSLRERMPDHGCSGWRGGFWRTITVASGAAIGDALEVSFPCDDVVLASCIAPPHLAGRFGAGMQWVIPSARIYNDAPAVYQRVGMR